MNSTDPDIKLRMAAAMALMPSAHPKLAATQEKNQAAPGMESVLQTQKTFHPLSAVSESFYKSFKRWRHLTVTRMVKMKAGKSRAPISQYSHQSALGDVF